MGLSNAGSYGCTTEPPVRRWRQIPWVSLLAICRLFHIGKPFGLQYVGCRAAKGRPNRVAHVVYFPPAVYTSLGGTHKVPVCHPMVVHSNITVSVCPGVGFV